MARLRRCPRSHVHFPIALTRPNAVDTTYGYDPVSRLTSILHKLGTTTLDGASYTYDGAGNR